LHSLPFWHPLRASIASLQDSILALTPCHSDTFWTLACRQSWLSSFDCSIPADSLSSKQSFSDNRPGVLQDRAIVEADLESSEECDRFLTAASPHSDDWLHALPIAACGLRVGHGSLFQNPTQPKISGPNPTHKSLHPTQPNPSSILGMAY